MGLLARALELQGIPATLSSWNSESILSVRPPRSTLSSLRRGMTLGHPFNADQQIRILEASLNLLGQEATSEPIILDES